MVQFHLLRPNLYLPPSQATPGTSLALRDGGRELFEAVLSRATGAGKIESIISVLVKYAVSRFNQRGEDCLFPGKQLARQE